MSDYSLTADSTAARMEQILAEVAPAIFTDVWDYFGHMPRQDDDGNQKCTGILYRRLSHEDGVSRLVLGTLVDEEKSFATAGRKIQGIIDNDSETSVEIRNVDVAGLETWAGGAYGERIASAEIDAITGLPELGDHALLAAAQLHSDRITLKIYNLRTSADYPGVREALEFVGVSEENYLGFCDHVEQLCAAAELDLIHSDQSAVVPSAA